MTKDEVLKKKIGFISLGCDKNRVDLENMIANIKDAGFEIVGDEQQANIIVVNTCAFLQSSRDESLSELQELQQLRENALEKVIVTGCINRYKNLLKDELFSLIDELVPIKENCNIVSKIFELYGVEQKCEYDECNRVLTTPSHIAYLKIAEGCNNRCAYCAIPSIRGKYVSRSIESLTQEATRLALDGVKELIIVAQDVTNYGFDLYKKRCIIDLLTELEKIDGIEWIRLHYCYPEYITDELIDYIQNSKKVVNYIDVPFQHIVDDVLIMMNRKNTTERTYELVEKLKKANISIRSTFIVGFPGETKQEFKALCKFLKCERLDNVGFFAYSNEIGTKAYEMVNQVPEKVKAKRLKKVEKIQTKVYKSLQKEKIGKEYSVIIDEKLRDNVYLGRTEHNSYMVDSSIVFVALHEHNNGDIIKVKVTGNEGIDLLGEEV